MALKGESVAGGVRIITVTETDWAGLRAIRLEMIADSPLAFQETYAAAAAHEDTEWHARARRNAGPGFIGVAAVDPSGRWLGFMRGELGQRGAGNDGANLYSVYVSPDHRGPQFGVTDALLDRVEDWAREHGQDRMLLEVHQDNPRAQAYYRRRGYTFTGHTSPYPLDETQSELQMSRPL